VAPARPGHSIVPHLYVGPSRFGTLEVLAEIGPCDMVIFHAMPLRLSTQADIDQQGAQQP